jgi:3D-(3,5/4)-trihydroxycyclohexane-1,2-dione acylhydrolase (decyclizing)
MIQRLTTAQALVKFLESQYVCRDGRQQRFFAGCFGIFGHGNVAGMGQALEEIPSFPYYLVRNEQAMVHTAAAFAKASNRLRAFACTSSIGPGATNMITGAATATVNRLPVLLLPGDIFAQRTAVPVLQQLESPSSQDISVNDCFRPVARYWDRIQRPEQLISAMLEAMRVMTSPAETGAVVVCLPQDVQPEALDFPAEFLQKRVWTVPRQRCDQSLLREAAGWIAASRKPLIIAGGGVIFSEATDPLSQFAASTGIPVVETQAGKGSLPFDHPQALGAVGVTGTEGATILAREADLIIGIGTRYTDFTTASRTAFQNPHVRFVNINVAEFDAYKNCALPLIGDARAVLEELRAALGQHRVDEEYRQKAARLKDAWESEVDRIYSLRHGPPISQGEVIGAVNSFAGPKDVVVCAAGSMPGDLHKLWRARDPKGYHLEYGYSCMGYEIAGGLGVKMAAPEREVFVLVGDGSYLMMAQEIGTSIQENYKLNIVLVENHGFSSIGGLSRACGNKGMGTEYRMRGPNGSLAASAVPIDYVANAESLGARACKVRTREELKAALREMARHSSTTVIVVETDYHQHSPSYGSWWEVPIAEVSESESVQAARERYVEAKRRQKTLV